jgi:L-threonate 2-dehydrogenase
MAAIGFIGLGSMGLCLAKRLIGRGWSVAGHDPAPGPAAAFREAGGEPAASAADLARACPVLLVALNSEAVYRKVIDEIAVAGGQGGWLLDINTLDPSEKLAARDRLAGSGWTMLDCTVSGTPVMVEKDLHSVYVSGDLLEGEVERLVGDLAEKRFHVGDFGHAARIKLIINMMVICHNVVAAEAMALGLKAGLAPEQLYDLIAASAGTSRIFEVRGRMMVAGDYPEETMYSLIADKDGPTIADFARRLRVPLTMLPPALQAHVDALTTRWAETDPASLCAVIEDRTHHRRDGAGE